MTTPAAAAHTPAYGVATLTTCDTEPIHVPGAIQPHGVLLALDTSYVAVMVSANTVELLGVPAEAAVGRSLVELVGVDLAALVELRVADGYPTEPLVVVHGGREVDVRVHASGDRTVVELEPLVRDEGGAGSYRSARSAMTRLAQTTSLEQLTDLLAREVRNLSGFDRVMVYRFDEEWNGEVIAETKRDDLNPFLGLHYPATDIPAQARRLYTLNPIRLIADIGYVPVPLHPVFDPGTDRPLDLSFASLRSVSPIHVEYLSHMGVTASMSISIVIDDELWGLIACHHYSGAHRPSQDARAAAEFVTEVASHLVAHRERADAREAAVATQTLVAALTSRMSASDQPPLDAMIADPSLLALVDATGLALNFDGAIRTVGSVPPPEVLQRIADLTDDPDHYVSSTRHLAGLDPELAGLAATCSGVLRIGSQADRWLMWFRPEQPQVVDWGGDPSNKRLAAQEGAHVRLSPRRSFEKWREVTHGRSEPFRPWHLDAADELGRHTNSLLLLRSREQITMAESMQRSVVLDRAPTFEGVELVARYRPASSYQLGGDWWDAFELPGRRLVFVVGDVAGHGVAAATAMTQLRTALRAYLYEGHSPAQCLDRLDRLMDGLLGLGIATALVAVLDLGTGEVEIASAGHPAPLLVGADSAHELDVERRPLLGVGSGTAPTTRVVLGADVMLAMFTDGLVERRGADLGERTERLLELAARRPAGEGMDGWADRVLGALDSTDDDTTLLVLRRSPPA
ncbi:SpoIIE family protein phosphatase [Nocardioides sp. 1609]|uniref:SpoIIE family protein phosphatase n=1 Tax=Nocardioides sp. 1609 TaxID=2508327 RepID=UPI00106FEDF7|nr:SpoIIE family protein phosphatase [Nocardioides sp. 1609]